MPEVNYRIILAILGIAAGVGIHNSILDYDNNVNAQIISGKSGEFTKSMKTYTNDQYKFKISFPTNWDKIEFTPGITEGSRQIIVTFLSPLENPSDSFREYLTVEIASFSPVTTVDKAKMIQYAKNQLDGNRKSLKGFQLLAQSDQSNNTELEMGNTGCYKMLYNYIDATIGKISVFDIYCTKDSKIYFLSFQSDSSKYSLYLPVLKQIINSFKLT
ncbi:MAG TPA: PsbP-related protein [Nitrososphaeraceae archaeon]|jgi:hypothetical protein